MASKDKIIIEDLGKEAIILAARKEESVKKDTLFELNHSVYIGDLKNENLSDDLREKFRKEGHKLSESANLRYMNSLDNFWEVVLGDRPIYILGYVGDNIKVYGVEIESKMELAKMAKKILEDSKDIFGEFKEELDYEGYSLETLRQTKIDKLEKKGILKPKKKSNLKSENENFEEKSMVLDDSKEIELKHRKWLVALGEKEKKKYFLDLRKKAKDSKFYLESDSHSVEEYGDIRGELLDLMDYRDLYSIAYKNEALMEYLENAYIKFQSTNGKIYLAPELPLYLRLWDEAIKNDYDKLMLKKDSLQILLRALDVLSLRKSFEGSHKLIKSIAKKAEKKEIYEGDDEEKLEQILQRVK